ncbi:hypothetical protein AWC38_SpisGene19728 [Stylophora pistillata]|uniref:TLDc domain-containing protein n=1 Tax=Stylophora pistillata TaxID=50429 RepID=A0A2B4REG6_STYPI|nr:hypothetical protein AWC38_SpisGene19728 [Stylophora pistillata]
MNCCRFPELSFLQFLFLMFGSWIFANHVANGQGKTVIREPDQELTHANFKVHKFSYLNITSIGSDYVMEGNECGFACVNMPSCFSFNLALIQDIIGRLLCEFLPSDIYSNSDKFIASQSHHHFSVTQPADDGALIASSILSGLDRDKYLGVLVSYMSPVLMDSSRSVFVRCWHAKTDGWAAATFHNNCDGKGPTVTLILVNSYIFGGYTNVPWNALIASSILSGLERDKYLGVLVSYLSPVLTDSRRSLFVRCWHAKTDG